MRRSDRVHLSASVGNEAANHYPDVLAAQHLLNEHLLTPFSPLTVDGRCGPRTIAVITEWQRRVLALPRPDGRMDPHGPTLRTLNDAEQSHRMTPATSGPRRPGTPRSTSNPTPTPSSARPASRVTVARPAPRPHPHTTGHHRGHVPPDDVILAAQASQRRWKVPASVSLAQWAWESGWGHLMPTGSNNPFGIKARKGERFVMAWTHEVVHGKRIRILAPFRVFDNVEQAFDGHGEFLATRSPYFEARKHTDDADAYARALTGVYATEPGYGDFLIGLMRGNNFYQYNQ